MVNKAYTRSQKIYKKTQPGTADMSKFVQRVITPEILKFSNLNPPFGSTIEQYADAFSKAYEIGHKFMVYDIKLEQEYQDEQFARVLEEHDEHYYGDEEYAIQLQRQLDSGKRVLALNLAVKGIKLVSTTVKVKSGGKVQNNLKTKQQKWMLLH